MKHSNARRLNALAAFDAAALPGLVAGEVGSIELSE
jgi:hypothetical protein